MDIKSTAREGLKAYLDGLSEKQRRGILVAMLAFTCVISGIVLLRAAGRLTPARECMELPFGEGSLSDTLRRLPDPLKEQVISIYRTIKQPQQNGKQEKQHGRRTRARRGSPGRHTAGGSRFRPFRKDKNGKTA